MKGAGREGYDTLKGAGREGYDNLKAAARYKGDGGRTRSLPRALQSRLHSRDAQRVKDAVRSIVTDGNKANYFGLGYDGATACQAASRLGYVAANLARVLPRKSVL